MNTFSTLFVSTLSLNELPFGSDTFNTGLTLLPIGVPKVEMLVFFTGNRGKINLKNEKNKFSGDVVHKNKCSVKIVGITFTRREGFGY
jgi:hypothetical protein